MLYIYAAIVHVPYQAAHTSITHAYECSPQSVYFFIFSLFVLFTIRNFICPEFKNAEHSRDKDSLWFIHWTRLDSHFLRLLFFAQHSAARDSNFNFFHSWLWATKNGLGKEVETKSFRIKQNDCLLPIYSMCMRAPGLDAVASTAHGNLILPFAALSAPSSNVPHIALTTLAVCFSCVA